jgi:hypothetical protein
LNARVCLCLEWLRRSSGETTTTDEYGWRWRFWQQMCTGKADRIAAQDPHPANVLVRHTHAMPPLTHATMCHTHAAMRHTHTAMRHTLRAVLGCFIVVPLQPLRLLALFSVWNASPSLVGSAVVSPLRLIICHLWFASLSLLFVYVCTCTSTSLHGCTVSPRL